MKRILHIVSHLKKNGTETFIMNIYRAIDRHEFHFDFLTFSSAKEGYYDEILYHGGKIFFVPDRKKGIYKYHRSLDNFFATHASDYDIVHFHVSSLTTVAPLYYAKKHGIKKRIIHMHSSDCTGLHNKILHRLNRLRISGLATDYLGCSTQANKWGFIHTKALNQSKVITNGIDLSKYYPDTASRKATRDALGISENPIILHVGSFNPIKNHKFLLDSFAVMLSNKPEAKLICVGDGPTFESVSGYAAKIGISDNIMFLGRRDDIADIMRASDLFVLPSLYEGLGIVLIEAQACGLKVLASSGVPIETKINDDATYLPLEKGKNYWARKMAEMLDAPSPQISDSINFHSVASTVKQMTGIYSHSF